MNIFKHVLKLKGFDLKKATLRLNAIKKAVENDVEGHQSVQKWNIFNHHIHNNTSYRTFIGDRKFDNWDDVPVMNKKDIQLPVEERLSKGFNPKNVYVHNTSGSSGVPLYFAKDKDTHALTWAIIFNRFGWHKIEIGRDLQARFYGIPLNTIGLYKEKIKDIIARRVRFPVYDLSDPVLAKFLDQFTRTKFICINGYTSSLVLFAKYLIKNEIILKDVCPTLTTVFTTSEVCDDIDRAFLSQGFGVKIVNEYGAAELDLIAFEDINGNWVVNCESILVEILDDNNNACKLGEEGRIVVTSLYNKAMPFIRYEIGDLAIFADENVGHYRILKKVVGRTNDIVILPSGKKSPGLTFYYISKSLLESGGFMKEFIIKQTTLSHFHFEYLAEREINDSEKELVLKAMKTYLEDGLTASFEKKNQIERTKAGKLKHFFSEINS